MKTKKGILAVIAIGIIAFLLNKKCDKNIQLMALMPSWKPGYFLSFALSSVKKMKDGDAYNLANELKKSIDQVDTYPNVVKDIFLFIRDQVELSQICLAYENKFKRVLLADVLQLPESILCTIANRIINLKKFSN